jgi:hypothetical protein
MRLSRVALMSVAAGALIGAPALQGATVKNGSPKLSSYRGRTVAVVFFHPF